MISNNSNSKEPPVFKFTSSVSSGLTGSMNPKKAERQDHKTINQIMMAEEGEDMIVLESKSSKNQIDKKKEYESPSTMIQSELEELVSRLHSNESVKDDYDKLQEMLMSKA